MKLWALSDLHLSHRSNRETTATVPALPAGGSACGTASRTAVHSVVRHPVLDSHEDG